MIRMQSVFDWPVKSKGVNSETPPTLLHSPSQTVPETIL